MRVFGTILSLLAVAALVIGAATAVMLYTSGLRMYEGFERVRGIVQGDIEVVRGTFDDVNTVYEESRQVVEDYERHGIEGVDDERVRQIFGKINSTMQKTRNIREKTEGDIETVENMVNDLTREGLNLVPVAVTSIVSLVISGWLFGFGVWFRAAARG